MGIAVLNVPRVLRYERRMGASSSRNEDGATVSFLVGTGSGAQRTSFRADALHRPVLRVGPKVGTLLNPASRFHSDHRRAGIG